MLLWRTLRYPVRKEQPFPLLCLPRLLLFLAIFLLPLLASCGGSAAQGPTVSVLDNEFSPRQIHVKVGESITWTNNGQVIHTVTSDDGKFDSGNFDSGKSYVHAFTQPGTYPYHCILHGTSGGGGMAGVVIVDAGGGGNTGSVTNQTRYKASPSLPGQGETLRVPEDYPTISAAVLAAKPGSLISIAPGIYNEAVDVKTPNLTIRGRDRNKVILDGQFTMPNAFKVVADNVVLENMTARHYISNGFYWINITGYRGSYLTAYSNLDYGVYAFGSVTGQFDHSIAAGHPDSGFYIGGCQPCHAVISNVISEANALGYSGTNAGGDLIIRDSIWRNNMAGIVPNTLDTEPRPPEAATTIINNLVENNNNYDAPSGNSEYPAIGDGIVLAGGSDNIVMNNRVSGHKYYGILVVPNIDKNFWIPRGNVVKQNVISNSGVADLALAALSGGNNCFSDNTVARTIPAFLQYTHACGSLLARAGAGDPSSTVILFDHFMQVMQKRFVSRDWKTAPIPADVTQQPGMPDPTIPPQGIMTSKEGTDLNMTLSAPEIHPMMSIGGVGLATPFFEILLGFYTFYLPLALYAAWLSVATWDIGKRSQLKGGARIGWLAVVFLIPILGPIAYYLFGRSELSRGTRWALVVGAPVVYVVLSLLLLFFVS